tara:strand:+ start:1151 stop:1471 length:321 start_codon:yes stop_codon:yes gene_type:complete
MRKDGVPDHDRYSENQSDNRVSARITAIVHQQDNPGVPVLIGNLSRYGVKVESNLQVEIGEVIKLSIDGLGDFEGVVRWSGENQFGVHSFDTIDLNLIPRPKLLRK